KAGKNAKQKMQQLGTQPGLEVGTTEPFSRQSAIVPLGTAPAVNAAGFELAKGGVSDPIRTPRGWVVLHVADVKAPHLPGLPEVKDAVRRDVEADRQRQQAFARIAQARAAAGAGAPLEAVAAQLGTTVQETPEFGAGAAVPGIGYAPGLAREVSKQ